MHLKSSLGSHSTEPAGKMAPNMIHLEEGKKKTQVGDVDERKCIVA